MSVALILLLALCATLVRYFPSVTLSSVCTFLTSGGSCATTFVPMITFHLKKKEEWTRKNIVENPTYIHSYNQYCINLLNA